MVSTLCLLACAFLTGQSPEWQLQPQLTRGQELVYSGAFTEMPLGSGAEVHRSFRVDTNVLVMDSGPQKFDLAFFTVVTTTSVKSPSELGVNHSAPSSVRLELVSMDRQGKLLSPALSLVPPLEGPPTIECGFFLELPKFRVGPESIWDINEEGRSPRKWSVDGTEIVNNVFCVRLMGVQQSQDWDNPRADRGAWQRRDTVWMSLQGLTCRYKRVIERRDPARQTASHRSVLSCDLTGGISFKGKLFEDRRREIIQARKFSADAENWLREPAQHKQALETTLKKIKQYCEAETPTPYRKAVVQVQKRIEAVLRGESVLILNSELAIEQTPIAFVGQRIPDFVCTDLLTRQTLRLQSVLGKPVIVMFYNPATENGKHTLRLGQTIAQRYPKAVAVLPMAVTDDPEEARRQHKVMNLPFSILDGKGLLQLFAVDALPRVVVLDPQGVVRAAWTGWGSHTADEVGGTVRDLIAH